MLHRSSSDFPPIPGTERPRRGLFVDRWGTLFELPERGFCSRFDQLAFTPGALEALFRARQADFELYLIGNEDAVAFGHLAASTWQRLEQAFLEHMDGNGVLVRRSYACLDHPEGKPPHQRPSVFLFPNTGVFYHAAQEDGIALEHSWVIGDGALELAAGDRAGCRVVALNGGRLRNREVHVETHLEAADLARAVGQVLALDRYTVA